MGFCRQGHAGGEGHKRAGHSAEGSTVVGADCIYGDVLQRPPCCPAFVAPPLPVPPLLDEATKQQLVSFQGPRLLKNQSQTFLVVQWLRICLPMQRTRIQSLVPEDGTCCGTIPMHHSYEARAPEACAPQEKPPLTVTREHLCAAAKIQISQKYIHTSIHEPLHGQGDVRALGGVLG